jgi:hypothetical protein
MSKFKTQADANKAYHFSKIPAMEPERGHDEILEASIRDGIEECDLILTGARKAADERHVAVYQLHRDRLVGELKKHGFFKEGDETTKARR